MTYFELLTASNDRIKCSNNQKKNNHNHNKTLRAMKRTELKKYTISMSERAFVRSRKYPPRQRELSCMRTTAPHRLQTMRDIDRAIVSIEYMDYTHTHTHYKYHLLFGENSSETSRFRTALYVVPMVYVVFHFVSSLWRLLLLLPLLLCFNIFTSSHR